MSFDLDYFDNYIDLSDNIYDLEYSEKLTDYSCTIINNYNIFNIDTTSDTTSDTMSDTKLDTTPDTTSATTSDTKLDTTSDTTSDTKSNTKSDTNITKKRQRQLKINSASRRCRKKQKIKAKLMELHIKDLHSNMQKLYKFAPLQVSVNTTDMLELISTIQIIQNDIKTYNENIIKELEKV